MVLQSNEYGSYRAPLCEIVANCTYPNMCYAKVNWLGPVQSYKCVHPSTWQTVNKHGDCFSNSHGLLWLNSPRLGLALHHHIHVGAGVVDPDYTGPVQVLLLNLGYQNHTIKANNHIAQLILERIAYPILCEVLQIPQTEHGAQGFGSTRK